MHTVRLGGILLNIINFNPNSSFKKFTMNKILITGGVGFLGSHLTEKLLKEGNDVLVVDNYFTGTKENLAHLLPNPRLELMRHDVTFPLYVETNQIYNLACPASPNYYQQNPIKTSVMGAINVLGLASPPHTPSPLHVQGQLGPHASKAIS
jgi:nucleoside-diphosphate-sugar epimerase